MPAADPHGQLVLDDWALKHEMLFVGPETCKVGGNTAAEFIAGFLHDEVHGADKSGPAEIRALRALQDLDALGVDNTWRVAANHRGAVDEQQAAGVDAHVDVQVQVTEHQGVGRTIIAARAALLVG